MHGPRLSGDDRPWGKGIAHEVEGFGRSAVFRGGCGHHAFKEARCGAVES